MRENSLFDKKSLKNVVGKITNFEELAKDCVCFANSQGGEIHIGIEDKQKLPPSDQIIEDEVLKIIRKRIPSLTVNVGIDVRKETAENGGEYIVLKVFRSRDSVASTSSGKYYVRVSDECRPVLPDELERLFSDKGSFVWETKIVGKQPLSSCDKIKLNQFITDINNSDRVSKFVKDMDTTAKLEYYQLLADDFLTNLGILWLGTQRQRASLHYSPSVQYIKYDENGIKVKKLTWDDNTKTPKEIINEIINDIQDWDEYVELPDGMFRTKIYNYEKEIIRELIANAFVHRNYSIKGDIFINLFSDRLEIHSPGLLPLGVTPENILTKSVQRNQLLAKVFYDLRLMEKEGSGYDMIYEMLLANGKKLPLIEEGDDRVTVILYKRIISNEIIEVVQRASEFYQLSQKEIITLGLIAQKGNIPAIELSRILNVKRANELKNWLGRLLTLNLILSKGKTKGTLYFVNPDFLRQTDFVSQTTLKRIEPHRLKELILADLKDYPNSSIGQIHKRIGLEINRKKIKRKLDDLMEEGLVTKAGVKKGTKYFIAQKG